MLGTDGPFFAAYYRPSRRSQWRRVAIKADRLDAFRLARTAAELGGGQGDPFPCWVVQEHPTYTAAPARLPSSYSPAAPATVRRWYGFE